jgi:hypothetical protein
MIVNWRRDSLDIIQVQIGEISSKKNSNLAVSFINTARTLVSWFVFK